MNMNNLLLREIGAIAIIKEQTAISFHIASWKHLLKLAHDAEILPNHNQNLTQGG
jgi:hypothetical protein